MPYESKTIAKWRGATDGGARRKGFTATIVNAADLSGIKPPTALAKCIVSADRASEHRLAAAKIRQDADKAIETATKADATGAAEAAMRAARSGDFAEVLNIGPGTLPAAEIEAATAKRIEKCCAVAEKAAHRDLIAEASDTKGREWLGKIWAAAIVAPYTGDSMKEAAEHEVTGGALRTLVTSLALATDPEADDPLVSKHLRKALRESDSPTMPTAAALRAGWAQRTREDDEAIAAEAEAKRAENADSAAETARHRNPRPVKVSA